jgi:hypothetical protein
MLVKFGVNMEITLGKTYRDKIMGFTGRAIAITHYNDGRVTAFLKQPDSSVTTYASSGKSDLVVKMNDGLLPEFDVKCLVEVNDAQQISTSDKE